MAEESGSLQLRSREDVQRLFVGKPTEWAQVLAARAALRALPLLAPLFEELPPRADINTAECFLALLRGALLPSLVATTPSRAEELRLATSIAASAAAYAFTYTSEFQSKSASFTASAAATTASAASIAAYAGSAAASAIAASDLTETLIGYDALSHDAAFLTEVGRSAALLVTPLWGAIDPPVTIDLYWSVLSDALRQADGASDWSLVWIDWYEAIRDGRAPWGLPREVGEQIMVEAMLWPQEEWDKGALHINRRIAGLIEAARAKIAQPLEALSEDEVSAIVVQRPAAHVFVEQDGRIVARPLPSTPADAATAAALQAEVLAKAKALRERLAQRGAELRPVESLDRLIEVLDGPPDAINVGLLLSRRRSIEADRKAYDSEEGRDLLFPGALAAIEDVAETTADLLAGFPAARQIEAGRVALDLVADPARRRGVAESLDAIAAQADEAPFVDETAQAALHAYDTALAEERDVDVVAAVLADRALDTANFVRRLAASARDGSTPAVNAIVRRVRTAAAEAGGLGADSWAAVRKGFPKGLEKGSESAGKILPPVLILLLLAMISKELALLAGAAQGLKSLSGLVDRLTKASEPEPDVQPDPSKRAEAPAKKEARKSPARKKPVQKKPVAKKGSRESEDTESDTDEGDEDE